MVKERKGGKVKRILEQQNFLFTFLSFRFFIFPMFKLEVQFVKSVNCAFGQ